MPVYRHPSPLRKNRRRGSPLSDFSREVGEAGTRANWLEKNNLQKIIINPKELLLKKNSTDWTDKRSHNPDYSTVQYRRPLSLRKRGDICVQATPFIPVVKKWWLCTTVSSAGLKLLSFREMPSEFGGKGEGGQAELRLNKVFNGETPAGSPNPYPFKLYTIIFNIKGTTFVYFYREMATPTH